MADKKKDSNNLKSREIPKVIELNPSSVVSALEQILAMAKSGKIECFIFAGFTPDNLIVSSKADIDIVEQQHLVSFLQTETTIRTISETFVITADEYLGDNDNDDDE